MILWTLERSSIRFLGKGELEPDYSCQSAAMMVVILVFIWSPAKP